MSWKDEWGGALQLFDKNMEKAIQTIYPRFNTAVIFKQLPTLIMGIQIH